MLCPLLRKRDYESIKKAGAVFIDANNRFPDPSSNHTSFSPFLPGTDLVSPRLLDWFSKVKIPKLFDPHRQEQSSFFNEFMDDWDGMTDLPHSIMEFCKLCPIPEVNLVHYFGLYDQIHYGEQILDPPALESWAKSEALKMKLEDVKFIVPKAGAQISL